MVKPMGLRPIPVHQLPKGYHILDDDQIIRADDLFSCEYGDPEWVWIEAFALAGKTLAENYDGSPSPQYHIARKGAVPVQEEKLWLNPWD